MKKVLALLIIITAAVLVFSAFFPYDAGAQCRSETGGYCVGLAQVIRTYPGLEFLRLPEGITIGGLLSRLYVFGVGLAALAAFVVFIIGGIIYLTAGDNEGRVTRAKSFMKNAVFGLALALVSWLILFTINRDLVRELSFTLPDLPEQLSVSQNSRDACIRGGFIWCGALNRCVGRMEECIGGGAREYRWVREGLNQFCRDILGPGWRDVEPRWCGGTPPPGMNACCGNF